MKKLRLIDEAEAELAQITLYYAANDEHAAARLFQEITNAFSQIVQHPKIGAPFRKQYRKLVLKKFPYNIFYEETETAIEIMSIAHQSRKPDYWLGRN